MLRRVSVRYVLLPLAGFLAYLWAVQLLGTSRQNILFAENGIVELGTAGLFLLAAGMAMRLVLKLGREVPRWYRAALLMFGIASCFVALEEMSYGQHLFGWIPPTFFLTHSTKPELNLHNLFGDCLGDLLRQIADASFPLFCILLPLALRRNRAYFTPGHWSYLLLPKTELIVAVLLAQAMSPLHKLSKCLIAGSMVVRPGEMQELYWSLAALLYMCAIQQRLLDVAEEADVLPFHVIEPVRVTRRMAA